MSTLFQMLSGAAHFKENKIKSFCLNFAHKNIKEFVAREKDVHELGVPLFQEAMEISLNPYEELPEESEPLQPSTLNEDFKKLYEQTTASKLWADGFVMVQNKKVPFHKAVLAGHSAAFRKELQPRGEEDLTEVFELGDMKVESFHSMLKFVYYGETTLNASIACDLAPFAKRWKLSELQRIAENCINGNVGADNVLSVLKVAYLKENLERDEMKQLRTKCLTYITEHISEVNLDALNQMEIRVSVDILRAWKKTQA
jgi:BTB/POZ domain